MMKHNMPKITVKLLKIASMNRFSRLCKYVQKEPEKQSMKRKNLSEIWHRNYWKLKPLTKPLSKISSGQDLTR